jgi:hypothetical protein
MNVYKVTEYENCYKYISILVFFEQMLCEPYVVIRILMYQRSLESIWIEFEDHSETQRKTVQIQLYHKARMTFLKYLGRYQLTMTD